MRRIKLLNLKKISRNICLALLVLSLTACGSGVKVADNSDKNDDDEVTTEATEETTEATTEATEATTEATEEETTEATTEEETTEVTTEAAEEEDYAAIYEPILAETLEVISNYDDEKNYHYLSVGLMETVMYGETDELLNSIGYVMEDISGDFVPELLIGQNGVDGEGNARSAVYSAYTIKDGEPVLFFEGWARNAYYWIPGGYFYYLGSGGAASTAIGKCHPTIDGTDLEWDDFIFTDEVDGEMGIYENFTGSWDSNFSDQLDIDQTEFWEINDEFENQCEDIGWDLVKDYGSLLADGYVSTDDSGSLVLAEWADDVVDNSTNYIAYEPDEPQPWTVHVLFTAKKEVKNFRLVTLEVKNIDDDGNIEYLYTEYYSLDKLSPDMPLCAGLDFVGDIPNNGFMYEDEDGVDHLFVVGESGMDGSLLVWEY